MLSHEEHIGPAEEVSLPGRRSKGSNEVWFWPRLRQCVAWKLRQWATIS